MHFGVAGQNKSGASRVATRGLGEHCGQFEPVCFVRLAPPTMRALRAIKKNGDTARVTIFLLYWQIPPVVGPLRRIIRPSVDYAPKIPTYRNGQENPSKPRKMDIFYRPLQQTQLLKQAHPHLLWPQLLQVMQPSTICKLKSPQLGHGLPRGASPTAITSACGSDFRPMPSPSMKPIAII